MPQGRGRSGEGPATTIGGMSTSSVVSAVEIPTTPAGGGVGVRVDRLGVEVRGRVLVHGVTFGIEPGELVAIAGPSGAGKTTLLEALAGVRPTTAGSVRFERGPSGAGAAVRIGFVPQEDIIHRELPLRTSLRLAARLRLPGRWSPAEIEAMVGTVLDALELAHRADLAVGSLSGGQRKRASIATELLARPDVLFLDEPTSGLDPATALEVVKTLRTLASRGTTVVFTTHTPTDLARADRLVFVGPGGALRFVGAPDEAREVAGSDDLASLYTAIERRPHDPAAPARAHERRAGHAGAELRPRAARRSVQWSTLVRRTWALLAANRLTMAILFGSPALVVAMMVVLFPAGAAADPSARPTTAIQTAFWVAFAGFFFGLTAGLLQVVPEAAVVRRERLAGVRPWVYLAAKVSALAPVLAAVSGGMLLVLHVMDRLPSAPGSSPAALCAVVFLEALSALALGLAASAAVRDAAQATLALPMLCFPQVLFAGAVISVHDMAPAGSLLSHAMATRWGFEGIARTLGFGTTVDPAGELAGYRAAFTGSVASTIAVLVATVVVCLVVGATALRRRTR